MAKTVNLWCNRPETNNDKVYNVTMQQAANGTFEVYSLYGRRGCKLTLHIVCEGVLMATAAREFGKVLRARMGKGYKFIADDVATLGNKIPTVVQ